MEFDEKELRREIAFAIRNIHGKRNIAIFSEDTCLYNALNQIDRYTIITQLFRYPLCGGVLINFLQFSPKSRATVRINLGGKWSSKITECYASGAMPSLSLVHLYQGPLKVVELTPPSPFSGIPTCPQHKKKVNQLRSTESEKWVFHSNLKSPCGQLK